MAHVPQREELPVDPFWLKLCSRTQGFQPPPHQWETITRSPVYPHNLAELDANIRISIRLLRFAPGQAWELQVFALAEAPKYSCPSYSWGAGSQIDTALNFGQPECALRITQGLEAALLQISHISSEWLWADAVCIYQYDAVEKNHQISKMKLIYESAQDVFVMAPAHHGASEKQRSEGDTV